MYDENLQMLNEKVHNIITSRVISSREGLMYIDTPYLNVKRGKELPPHYKSSFENAPKC